MTHHQYDHHCRCEDCLAREIELDLKVKNEPKNEKQYLMTAKECADMFRGAFKGL